LIKVGEFFKAHKLPLAMIIVAGVLIFYAVGIATFFGSPVFSMFWIISAQTAHVLIYVAVVVAVVLGVMGSIIGFIKRRSVHVQVDSLQAQADSSGELHNEANGMLEEQPTLLENKEKAALRSSELLGVINASVGIVDLSFDVLIGLNENRINWQQLDGYSNGFGENFSFAGQSMPPLNLDFSKVFSAIKSRIPEETAKETYNILEAVYVYFNGSNFDDDIKESLLNFQNAKDVILAYFLLNDLLLGMVVGDKENKEEKGQLETVLQNLSNKSNFKVNAEGLRGSIDKTGFESDMESVIEDSRKIFKEQLKQLQSHVSTPQIGHIL
jgi:hypothetical protein